MPYQFVNDNHASSGGASSATITSDGAVAISASNLLVIATRYVNPTAQTTTMSDTMGTNVYVPITSVYVAANSVGLAFFYALNSTPGFTTFTATFSAASTNRAIYVGQYSGVTNLITSTGQENESPGTGANAYTSGNAPVNVVPAMAWGFLAPVHNFNLTPTAGTAPLTYVRSTSVWNFTGSVGTGLAEDARITVGGNYPATFTTGENSGMYALFAAFQETIPQQLGATGIFVTP